MHEKVMLVLISANNNQTLLTCCAELKEVTVLTYDLSSFSLDDFDRAKNQKNKAPYYVAYLTCKMAMSGSTVTVEILWNDVQLCKAKIQDVDRKSSVRSWS
jgi:hypothetical protein